MCVQSRVYRSASRPRLCASRAAWPSLGSPAKGHRRTPRSPRATAAMTPRATAARRRVCSRTCCAARITPSRFTPQMEHAAALEALQWKLTQVKGKIHICIYLSMYIHTNMCVRMHTDIYVCVYIHTYILQLKRFWLLTNCD